MELTLGRLSFMAVSPDEVSHINKKCRYIMYFLVQKKKKYTGMKAKLLYF